MPSRRVFRYPAAAVALLVALPACSDGGAGPEAAASVSLSVAAGVGSGSPGGLWGLSDGVHELALRAVRVVVGEVALTEGGAGEPLESGPFLMEVPGDRAVRSWVASAVPAGRYDGLRLAIHTPDVTRPADADFLAEHPTLDGVAVRIEGEWDGAPFRRDFALEDARLLLVDPPLEVRGRTANVTLHLDVASWFREPDGTLTDPVAIQPGTPEAAAVEGRIRDSFTAYEDPDADGVAGGD